MLGPATLVMVLSSRSIRSAPMITKSAAQRHLYGVGPASGAGAAAGRPASRPGAAGRVTSVWVMGFPQLGSDAAALAGTSFVFPNIVRPTRTLL